MLQCCFHRKLQKCFLQHKTSLTYHRHEDEQIVTELSFLGELILQPLKGTVFALALRAVKHSKHLVKYDKVCINLNKATRRLVKV